MPFESAIPGCHTGVPYRGGGRRPEKQPICRNNERNDKMPKKIILSGGGTGGHIYPAVAVAEALKRRLGDDVDLLFVGAEGKMEMEKVPALGYRIVGLPIAGLQRRLEPKNLLVPFKVLRSIRRRRRGGLRRLRQRPRPLGGAADGGADPHPGAELLRRPDEQDPRPLGLPHLHGLRGDGAFLPRRALAFRIYSGST